MLLRIFWLAAFLGVLTVCSCSGKTTTPITALDLNNETPLPVLEFVGEETNHSLMGMWNANFDLETLEVEISPERASDVHINVTSFTIPEFQINSWDPVTEVIDLDVKITNPYPIDVYDVRLIIYTDAVGRKLQNDNGWTPLYDIPGGLPVNPFTTYAKSIPGRLFEGETDQTENLQILLPGGDPNVTFAIDASYPDNCKEPHKIGNLSQGILYDDVGSSTMIQVGVYDHQNNVDSVGLYLPEITGTTALVPFSYIGYSGWEVELVNNTGAGTGIYDGYLVASSSDSGTLFLYDDVEIIVNNNDRWVAVWGDDREGFGDTNARCTVIDNDDSIYVTGSFYNGQDNGPIDLDPGESEDWHTSAGYGDVFLSKFDEEMNFIWARTWGGAEGWDHGYYMKIDPQGNIYVSGSFKGVVDFNPGSGEDIHFSNGELDVFISKFNPQGDFIWTRTWGGIKGDWGGPLTLDNMGNIYVVGSFRDIVDFNPGTGEDLHASNGSWDTYFCKYSPEGDFIWAITWGGLGDDFISSIVLENPDNIYLGGSFTSTVDFDPSNDGIEERTSTGWGDVYLSKFDSSGDFHWVRTWGGIGSDDCTDLALDGEGFIYGTGIFMEEVDFDPSTAVQTRTSVDLTDAYISKFDQDGNFQWVRTWGGLSEDIAIECVVDETNSIYIGGWFHVQCDFDPGPGVVEYFTNINADLYLLKLDPNGDFVWARAWGGTGGDAVYNIAINSSGIIHMTGDFTSVRVDFDPGPDEDLYSPIEDVSAFLFKVLPNGYWE